MSSIHHKIGSNHLFAAGSLLLVLALVLFPLTGDYARSLVLAMLGLSLLMAAIIESIGERDEITKKKGHKSLWAVVKIFLNGITLALLISMFAILVYLTIMSGTKALGLLIVIYFLVVALVMERQFKRHR
ncbi:MAG: hypothetical protein ABIG39_07290 [Candidatus Micrarchaeota archaeon]